MKNRLADFRTIPVIILALWGLAACDGTGSALLTDGDAGDLIIDPTSPCTAASDCPAEECECRETSDGSFCACPPPACTENMDCAYLGAGCYCQVDHCVCSVKPDGDDADGDGSTDGDDPSHLPRIGTEPSQLLNFGAVRVGQPVTRNLRILNLGEGILELNAAFLTPTTTPQEGYESDITDFTINGELPSIDNLIRLAAGDTHTLAITYNPINAGFDEVNLYIGSNVGTVEVLLTCEKKGNEVAAVECENLVEDYVPPPQYVDACAYGLVPVRAMTLSMPIHIKNALQDDTANALLVISDIKLDDPLNGNFTIDSNSVSWDPADHTIKLWPGEEEEITVNYTPLTLGFHEINLLVYHSDANQTSPIVKKLIGAGVVPDLRCDPFPSIEFGSVARGSSNTIGFTCTNRGGADLIINSMTLQTTSGVMGQVFGMNLDPDADGTDNVPSTLAPGESTNISLTCTPLGREPYSNMIEVSSNNQALPNSILYVPMTCTGITPYCEVFPRVLDYGCLNVGECGTRFVTISNNGQASARIEGITLSGSLNFEMTTVITPIDINPGQTMELEVTFCATTEGTQQATIAIDFKEGDGEDVEVTMLGCGIEPHITGPSACGEVTWDDVQVPPTSIPEGELSDWVEEREVTLTNDGSAMLHIQEVYIPSLFTDEFELILPNDNATAIVPPGNSWGFKVLYRPTSYGEDNAYIIVCSDAANAVPVSNYTCNDSSLRPHAICLTGTAIDPRLQVIPLNGKFVFRNVLVGTEVSDTFTIQNIGVGPLHIFDIDNASSSPIIFVPEGGIDPAMDTWPEEGYELSGGNSVSVVVKCVPEGQATMYNEIVISHDDKDAAKQGEPPGSQRDEYRFQVWCSSQSNTPPIAVAKSPAGVPAGPYGSRNVTVPVGSEINLDGCSSYDDDDDPETTPVEDFVTQYEWSGTDIQFTLPTNGCLSAARFDEPGDYQVKLRVKDNRGSWSTETMDSRLNVRVTADPIARVYICDTFESSKTIKAGSTLCFDGSLSEDPDGSITDYRFYVAKGMETWVNICSGSNPRCSHKFSEDGSYRVYLVVVDNQRNTSVEPHPYVGVEVFNDETLRVELSWSGGGDVNLHYIRPNGYFGDFSDCREDNPTPDWRMYGFGNPRFNQGSSNGISPEVIEHNNPGNGPPSYKVVAEYVNPAQQCGNVIEEHHYDSNCDICGCTCEPFCWIFRICCASCTVNENQWVCNDIAAMLTFRVYVNNEPYPRCTITGSNVKVLHEGDKYEFSLQRLNGKWICP